MAREVCYRRVFAHPSEQRMPTTTIDRVITVFQQQFDDDLTVTRETSAADVAGWDSLTLMLAIEKQFEIRFTSSQVASLKKRRRARGSDR